MEPLYTSTSVTPAYQLRWSLALFAKSALPAIETWLPALKDVVERDGVALAYMNNLAYAHDMQAVFCASYYVGTIGEYDTGAIWTSLASNRGPTDTGSVETCRE